MGAVNTQTPNIRLYVRKLLKLKRAAGQKKKAEIVIRSLTLKVIPKQDLKYIKLPVQSSVFPLRLTYGEGLDKLAHSKTKLS
tara:strand:- start:35679 stop:35924 length:246 start_codon:yes stop_codon:yes gene_type:complete